MTTPDGSEVVLIEPFYGGSHGQLMDCLRSLPRTVLYTMPDRKWPWRARTAALYLAQTIPEIPTLRTVFASSVLNLAEFIALRPDFAPLRKIIYFHENQLIYPVQRYKDRDFQFGYNQILSCLVADVVVFNSQFNLDSFLHSITTFLNAMPDHKPKFLAEKIRPKCRVIYFPIRFPQVTCLNQKLAGIPREVVCSSRLDSTEKISGIDSAENEVLVLESNSDDVSQYVNGVCTDTCTTDSDLCRDKGQIIDQGQGHRIDSGQGHGTDSGQGHGIDSSETNLQNTDALHILWPHRWEHDKDPELFFKTLLKLADEGCEFVVSVLGESRSDVPEVFESVREKLLGRVKAWGYQQNKQDYYRVLSQADVVVSTAKHEFFGVAVMEAVHFGSLPLLPNKLVYPELYPQSCLYNTDIQLYKRLKNLCGSKKNGKFLRRRVMDTNRFSWKSLKSDYQTLLNES